MEFCFRNWLIVVRVLLKYSIHGLVISRNFFRRIAQNSWERQEGLGVDFQTVSNVKHK